MPTSFSVVIPLYNAARYLGEALDSVLAQTRQPVDVVIVDDASHDDSVAVAERYAARHPHIRVLQHPANRGSGPARNTGVRAATGEVIAFLDADDRWDSRHLEILGDLLDRHPEAALASAHAQSFGDDDAFFRHRIPIGPPTRAFWPAFCFWSMPQNGLAVRKARFLEIGGFDEVDPHWAEDYDFVLRMAWRWPFVGADAVTVAWRRHAPQQSKQQDKQDEGMRRRRARFIASIADEASPEELTRMQRWVVRDWWDRVVGAGNAGDGEGMHALLKAGPPLHKVLPALQGWVRWRTALAPAYFSAPMRPLRAAYATAHKARRRALGLPVPRSSLFE